MRGRSRSIVDHYDRRAHIYEDACKVCRSDTGKIFQEIKACVAGNISGNLLDVGCGTGLASEPFASPGLKIYGIDGAPRMLKRFSEKGFAHSWKIVDLNKERLPFAGDFFDYVISNGVFCLLPQLDTVIEDVGRVIKGGGIFCFTVENVNKAMPAKCSRSGMDIYRHSLDYLNGILEKSGFNLISWSNYRDYESMLDSMVIVFTVILCQKK